MAILMLISTHLHSRRESLLRRRRLVGGGDDEAVERPLLSVQRPGGDDGAIGGDAEVVVLVAGRNRVLQTAVVA